MSKSLEHVVNVNPQGWETIYELNKTDFNKNSDALILFIHWMLTIENDFSCVGLGNEACVSPSESDNITDILPSGWNSCNPYTIRYILDENILFNLIGFEYRNVFYIHLLQPKTERMSTVAFTPSEIDAFKNSIDINCNKSNLTISFQEEFIQGQLIKGAIKHYNDFIENQTLKEKLEQQKRLAHKVPRSLRIITRPNY